ncbi:MAG: cytochrome b/b6 domain-containing protein [Proteobacteria bacterium]|nr:cytochrome b/b6 domain-containing protein [Pseudomonadota bacterium]
MQVWDPVVRLLHWALAGLVFFDLVYDDGGYRHRIVGYAAAVVVLLRLSWATIKRSHSLKPSIVETRVYLRQLIAGKPPRSKGHDPLGLWMVWLLWVLVLLLGITGWMSRLDMFWGDERVEGMHTFLANMLMASVAVHVLAVCAMSLIWKENLPSAMITGRKRDHS